MFRNGIRFSFALKEPVEIGDKIHDRLNVHLYNHDPSLAPASKTSMTVMLDTGFDTGKTGQGEEGLLSSEKRGDFQTNHWTSR